MKRLLQKLNSRKGESISEVLVALLISALGIVLLAAMISSSVRMIDTGRDKIQSYVEAENRLVERNGAADGTGTLTMTDASGYERRLTRTSPVSAPVVYYANDESGDPPVVAYKKGN